MTKTKGDIDLISLIDEVLGYASDQLVTGCGACGMQIHQGTMHESVHPVKLLSLAYQKEKATSSAA